MLESDSSCSMVVTGASGLVGRYLVQAATRAGWSVKTLTRGAAGHNSHHWDPAEPDIDALARAISGAQVLVNLAGASLAEGRLNASHRERVLQSRVQATQALGQAHAACTQAPPVWLQASAVGYYGDCGEQEVTEDAPQGSLFLSEVCRAWEEAARGAQTRLVILRTGLVLAPDAPAWQKMLTPIQCGVGGPLGPGTQWYAWITAEDLAHTCLFLVGHPDARDAFNLTTPQPIQQVEMTRQCAKALGRPAFVPVPAFALKAALGGVATELLLPSCRARPAHLEQLGFEWNHPTFEQALPTLL